MGVAASRARAALVGAMLLVVAGCSGQRFVRPAGAGVAVPDGRALWAEATRACRNIRTYKGALTLSGHIGAQPVSSVTLNLALDVAGHLGLSTRVAGLPLFILAGSSDAATLLWQREPRSVVKAPIAQMLEAVMGLKLGTPAWLAVMSGCLLPERELGQATRRGDVLTLSGPTATVDLVRAGAAWQPRAAIFDGVSVDYLRLVAGSPRDLLLQSDASGGHVAVRLRVQASTLNAPIALADFELAIPPAVEAMSVEELRAAGPLGGGPLR